MIKTTEATFQAPQNPKDNLSWYQATTLAERIEAGTHLQPGKASPEYATRRLNQWKEQTPFNRENYFSQRLSQANISEEELLNLLKQTPAELKQTLAQTPAWLGHLFQIFEDNYANDFDITIKTDNLQSQNIYMLLNPLKPLIWYGMEKLRQGVIALTGQHKELPFNPETIGNLFFSSLPDQLLPKLSRTIALELNVWRLQGRLQGETPEERFVSFVEQLNQPVGILSLLQEYPVLARQLLQLVNSWVNFSLEFITNLCQDWSEIRTLFCPDFEPGVLVEIEGGAGDTHRSGRSVQRLKFSSRLQLVYKPKSFDIDQHFQDLLVWLNQKGANPAFKPIKLLNRGSYGWSEYIHAASCQNRAEIERFYRRQGGYLAILYALEATDFHFENLIAAGEHPLLVDLEALFHPRVDGFDLTQSQYVAASAIGYSVLRVGLLPQRLWSYEEAEGIDVSGLSGKGGQFTPQPVPTWDGLGTDQMRLIRQKVLIPSKNNRAKFNGEDVNVLDYIDQISEGFSHIYQLLVTHREELLDGPLAAFATDEIRMILRSTNIYAKFLMESFHPDLLRNALERDRFFDRLWVSIDQRAFLSRVIPAEQKDLLAGDIPMFTTRPDSKDLFTSRGEVINDFFDEPSLESVKRRIQQLDKADMDRQLWFIRASFAAISMGTDQAAWVSSNLQPTQNTASQARLLAEAVKIGQRLSNLALYGENDVSWVGLSLVNERTWTLLPTGSDLYSGTPGIILFLAYLGKVTGDSHYTELARKALVTLARQREDYRKHGYSVGAFDGFGGQIYLFSHLGVLWNDPTMFAEAEKIVDYLEPLIEKDDGLDIISGSSGAIAALLSLYKVHPSEAVLAAAIKCGERLLERSVVLPQGIGWRTTIAPEVPLAGFSHGAAGIALSLLKLAAVTDDKRFQEAALQAMVYERSIFSEKTQNWPDLRPPEGPVVSPPEETFMSTWCHGAPGIGMARLQSLPFINNSEIRSEIDVAIKTTLATGFSLNHSLCHGDLGNLELLVMAYRQFGLAVHKEKLDTIAAMILDSIERQGWSTGIPLGVESPGLLVGLAGIGYELLRIAFPELLPSVLVLESPYI